MAAALFLPAAAMATGSTRTARAQSGGGPAPVARPSWCTPGAATLRALRVNDDGKDDVLCHHTATGQIWFASSTGTAFGSGALGASFCPASEGTFTTFKAPSGPSLLVCHRETDMLVRTGPSGSAGTVTYAMGSERRCAPSTGARFRFGSMPDAPLRAFLLCHNGDGSGAVIFRLGCASTSSACTPDFVETSLGVGKPADPRKNDFYIAQFDGAYGQDIVFHDREAKTDSLLRSTSASSTSFNAAVERWSAPASSDATYRFPCGAADDFGVADFTGDGRVDAWCRDRTTGDFWVGKVYHDTTRFNWQKWAPRFCLGSARVGTGFFNVDGPGTDGNTAQRADAFCHHPDTQKVVALAPLNHATNAMTVGAAWSSGF